MQRLPLLLCLFFCCMLLQLHLLPCILVAARTTTTTYNSTRILYIVTSLTEYDNGRRFTQRGSDRLANVMLPIVKESVDSMLAFGYEVDIYLILGFQLRPKRFQFVRDSLPSIVGLEVWDDAIPLAIDWGRQSNPNKMGKVLHLERCLSRQHRFVIKDKLLDYDLFVVFEDDMLIKGEHVQHYLHVSTHLQQMAQQQQQHNKGGSSKFYGELSPTQLNRVIPGFMRVEVLLDESKYGTQDELANVPIHNDTTTIINASICCKVQHATSTKPSNVTSDQLFIWETSIDALSVRHISGLGWVVMQSGPNQNYLKKERHVNGYWSGQAFPSLGRRPPQPHHPLYINNQGGWMATQSQLVQWHTNECRSGFLPPFDVPAYAFDGLDLRNVEYYSGGLQLAQCAHSCCLQRILVLEDFDKHLLYHSANNKQKQLQWKKQRFVKANHLLGQLQSVQAKAQEQMLKEQAATTT